MLVGASLLLWQWPTAALPAGAGTRDQVRREAESKGTGTE
jgi:hypothetical protein